MKAYMESARIAGIPFPRRVFRLRPRRRSASNASLRRKSRRGPKKSGEPTLVLAFSSGKPREGIETKQPTPISFHRISRKAPATGAFLFQGGITAAVID